VCYESGKLGKVFRNYNVFVNKDFIASNSDVEVRICMHFQHCRLAQHRPVPR